MAAPEKAPQGYTQTAIEAVQNHMIQIFYTNQEQQILIRKAKGTGDISGDYTQYHESSSINVNGLQIAIRGNDGKCKTAIWQNKEYAYSISHNGTGFEPAVISEMAADIR